jgi:L-ascorbate metabolism protein UlaG (beta-lactamase superfamily)
MKITYYGQSTFLFETDEHSVIIDPFISANPHAGVKVEDIRVSHVLLTHGHGDHILDAEPIARNNQATIVAPNELAGIFGKKGLQVHPMSIGGAHTFEFGRVKLTQAFHSSSVETEDGLVYAGMPVGIVLSIGGKSIYHAGDTGLFGDMKLIGEYNNLDVALLPIGDNFTMGPEDATLAAQWLHAGLTIPMHYNTFPLINQDGNAFTHGLEAKGLRAKELKPGESIEV